MTLNVTPNIFVPTAENFARNALATLPYGRISYGYWAHGFQVIKRRNTQISLRSFYLKIDSSHSFHTSWVIQKVCEYQSLPLALMIPSFEVCTTSINKNLFYIYTGMVVQFCTRMVMVESCILLAHYFNEVFQKRP